MGLSNLCNAMITTYLQQGDLFASPRPAYASAAPTAVAAASAPRLRERCPLSIIGFLIAPTVDIPTLVHDGIKNQTFIIE